MNTENGEGAPAPISNKVNDEAKKSKKGFSKFLKSKLGRIVFATTIGALGLGGGAYEAYQHDMLPGIHKTIDVPTGFNNAENNGVIGSNNIVKEI